MPTISHRSSSLPSSAVRKLVPFADEAKKEGAHVYHLNIGQPDIDSPKEMMNAISTYEGNYVPYTHSAGNISYRDKLVTYYSKHNIHINSDDLVVTASGSEALLFSMLTCMNPGDEIIIPEPFYTNYNSLAHITGVKIIPVTSNIEDGFKLPEIKQFEEKISDKTKAILICNPNNPTGYLYSSEELNQLKDLVLKHDLFLISDEVYREFVYDADDYVSILTIEGLEDNAIVLDSVSKRYNACGLRIGAFVSKNKDLIEKVIKLAESRLSPPALAQHVAEAAIETEDSYFEGVKEEYLKRRDYLVERLNAVDGVTCPVPGGAFYCVVKLPIDDSDKFCEWLLTDFRHENETVMLAPATGFYATEGLGKDEVRIVYVLKVEDLKKAIDCIETALEVYPGKTN